MTRPMRIAFYAPLKSPNHPTPSGDRRMAQMLMAALKAGGHNVLLASELRTFDGHGDSNTQGMIKAAAEAEIARLTKTWAEDNAAPDIWFSYHLYYKAPDLIGPTIAQTHNIPYIVAEPSYAPKRAKGPWSAGHHSVGKALQTASAVLCLTKTDMACIAPLLKHKERIIYFPPFLDALPFSTAFNNRAGHRKALARRYGLDPTQPWLIAVGMMRYGDKLESYRRLGAALACLKSRDWQLVLVGDGEARGQAEAAMAKINAGKVISLGLVKAEDMPETLASADVFVWPAAGEAYGMAILEAQAAGLPVIAGDVRGVPEVVKRNKTALLVPEDNPAQFAAATETLLTDSTLRKRMAASARDFVTNERSLSIATTRLTEALACAAKRTCPS